MASIWPPENLHEDMHFSTLSGFPREKISPFPAVRGLSRLAHAILPINSDVCPSLDAVAVDRKGLAVGLGCTA